MTIEKENVTIEGTETLLTFNILNKEAGEQMNQDVYPEFLKSAKESLHNWVKRELQKNTKEVKNVEASGDIKSYSDGANMGFKGAIDNIKIVLNFSDGSRQVINEIDGEPINSGITMNY